MKSYEVGETKRFEFLVTDRISQYLIEKTCCRLRVTEGGQTLGTGSFYHLDLGDRT